MARPEDREHGSGLPGDPISFGRLLRAVREFSGVSEEACAEKMGLSVDQFRAWEDGALQAFPTKEGLVVLSSLGFDPEGIEDLDFYAGHPLPELTPAEHAETVRGAMEELMRRQSGTRVSDIVNALRALASAYFVPARKPSNPQR